MDNNAYHVFEWIDALQAMHATEVLCAAAVVLLLIDYFFATDGPAQFGYFCLAAATFFIAYRASWSPLGCLLVFVACWVLLAILHRLVFYRFLSNAPPPPHAADVTPAEAAPEAGDR